MTRSRTLLALVLLLLTLSLSPPLAKADYNISLNNGEFGVLWKINAWQNLTAFQGVTGPVFPANISTSLASNDLSSFTSSLQKALQSRVNTATIDQASVQIKSNRPTYNWTSAGSSPLQWLNITIQFRVHENPTSQGGASKYELSWKAFSIHDDLKAGSASFNDIGEIYLLQALVPFLSFQNGIGRSMSVTVGKLPVTTLTYQTPTRNIVLLDTSTIKTPLENWTLTRDITSGTETWTSPDTAGFNAFAALRFTESAGSELSLNYYARTQFTAQVSSPIGATASRDALYIDTTGNLWDKAEFSIILGSLVTLIGAVIVERRVMGTSRTRRKSGKR